MESAGPPAKVKMSRVEVVAPNFKKRLSGVTSTIIQLVPMQARRVGIATLGPGLPDTLPKIGWRQLPGLLQRPATRPFRIWHARRNIEMLGGLVLRHLFRAPLRLVFTSASQRRHTAWSKFLIRRMDAAIAVSRKTASYLEIPNTVIMHGIDTTRFAPARDRDAEMRKLGLDPLQHYAGCVGRLRRQKGTDLFVDAMIALLPEFPGWSAIVAGRATNEHRQFETELKQRVAEAGLAGRILFVGEHADIPPWYRALSLLVAPQRWEGFGLTPLEAMASGVPVVAADVGAFAELVEDGVTGNIIAPDDLTAMIGAVRPYMADEARRQDAAAAALEHVRRNHPLQREANEIVSVYEGLWSKAGRQQ